MMSAEGFIFRSLLGSFQNIADIKQQDNSSGLTVTLSINSGYFPSLPNGVFYMCINYIPVL